MTDFKYSLTNLKPVESTKIALTFPDGAKREFPKNTTGLDIAKGISPSLAKRTVAMALDGTVADLADPIEHDAQNRIHRPRRRPRAGTDPARRRPCAGRSRADAVAGHAGHHRPGDRERLLLRLLPQRAVHAGGFCGDRKEDARDHRARQTLHQGSLGSRDRPSRCSATRARCFKVELVDAIPGDRDRSRSTSRATGSTSAAGRT